MYKNGANTRKFHKKLIENIQMQFEKQIHNMKQWISEKYGPSIDLFWIMDGILNVKERSSAMKSFFEWFYMVDCNVSRTNFPIK